MEKELFLLHELPENVREVALKNTYRLHAYWDYTYDRIVEAVDDLLKKTCPSIKDRFEYGFWFDGVFGLGIAVKLEFFSLRLDDDRDVKALHSVLFTEEDFVRFSDNIFDKVFCEGCSDGVKVGIRSRAPYDDVRNAGRTVEEWFESLNSCAFQTACETMDRYESMALLHDWVIKTEQRYDVHGVPDGPVDNWGIERVG